MVTVRRAGEAKLGQRAGLTTLEQRFVFRGVSSERLAKAIWVRPLVGERGILGEDARDAQTTHKGRLARDFRPSPMACFDLRLRREGDGVFVVSFSQPNRTTPYLDGEAVWLTYDDPTGDGAVLAEAINTSQALARRVAPLTGPKASLRRWLYFRFGHVRAMEAITSRLATLV